MRYEPNPKHKPLPQPGRRGSMCPASIGLAHAQALLDESDPVEGSSRKRFATDGTHAFCARLHDVTNDAWHGYPVDWEEVPPHVRAQWVAASRVSRRAMKRRPPEDQ